MKKSLLALLALTALVSSTYAVGVVPAQITSFGDDITATWAQVLTVVLPIAIVIFGFRYFRKGTRAIA